MLRVLTGSAAAVAAAGTHTPRTAAPSSQHIQPNGEPKIKHMVVMLMENRATDHIFGCMAGEGIIGLDGINGSRFIPKDPNNASAGHVEVTCGTADYGDARPGPAAPHSPSHSLSATGRYRTRPAAT
jgi:phospholipase C